MWIAWSTKGGGAIIMPTLDKKMSTFKLQSGFLERFWKIRWSGIIGPEIPNSSSMLEQWRSCVEGTSPLQLSWWAPSLPVVFHASSTSRIYLSMPWMRSSGNEILRWTKMWCHSSTNEGHFLESAMMLAIAPKPKPVSLDLHSCSILAWQKSCPLTFWLF